MNKSRIRVFFRPDCSVKYRPFTWPEIYLNNKPVLKSYGVEKLFL
jgi:hypothetical protein